MIAGEVHAPRSSGGATWLRKLRLPLPGWSLPVIEKSSESTKKKNYRFAVIGKRKNLVRLTLYARLVI